MVIAVAGGLLLGLVSGGRLGRLAELPVRRGRLVAAAALAQLVGVGAGRLGLSPGPAYAAGMTASAVFAVAFLLANRRLAGTGLVAAGLVANAAVLLANGAMPVSAYAAARSGAGAATVADGRHQPATAGTRLRPLGDVVAVPWPLRPEVVSPGDLLVAAGVAQLAFVGVRGRRRRRAARSAVDAGAAQLGPQRLA